MTTKNNHYEILEVNPHARSEVIKAAYKVLMQIYHPDINKNGEAIAKKINQAKEILLDEKLRSEYDKLLNNLEGKVLGNYNILELISDGELGTSYKAAHLLTDKLVCIKHAHYATPQDEEMIMNEAQALWDLRHYSIPSLRDVTKLEDGSLALVMSYIPGPTLEQVINKVGRLEPENVMWIMERSLNALKYLHYHGVVHGDLKPANIILQPESHMIALVNYGLSSVRPKIASKPLGYSPLYSSPEQIRGDKILPESDLYSLGLSMIYALGGDVSKRAVPQDVPDSICTFMKKLIVYDFAFRPNWLKEDLVDSVQNIRLKTFGRKNSDMKIIPGF